jgi:hypothetical protein
MNFFSYQPGFRESKHGVWPILVSGLLVGVLCQHALAVGTILSTGFDDYSDGPLQSQSGWLTAGAGQSTATVQSSTFLSPNKAVTVTRAASASGDQRWAKPVGGYPTQRFVTIDWDMRVSQPTDLTGFGPFFGVDTYDADVSPYVLGSLGVDATTGDVLFQAQDSGVLVESGSLVNFDAWNHFRIVLDFATDSYKGYLNSTLVASTGFVDRGFGLDNFTDADIATFAAAADPVSQTLSASAVFDNFVVRDGLMGDYDVDGDVDEADYVRWRMTFGSAVAPSGNLADGSGSGIVDAADYVAWRKHLGQSLFVGMVSGGSAVPETASALSLLIGTLLCWQAAYRRRVIRVGDAKDLVA